MRRVASASGRNTATKSESYVHTAAVKTIIGKETRNVTSVIAIQMLTYTKKSISAKELQRQLGHKSYNPIWAMLHKLRNAMGKRDSQYELCGTVELDEGFFSTEIPEEEKNKPLKRGRGSQKKTTVLVMAETDCSTLNVPPISLSNVPGIS